MLTASPHTDPVRAQAEIERLWVAHAHDPAQQALACATRCAAHAPYLAPWLKAKILAAIPDRELASIMRPPVTDDRLWAYTQLCELASLHPAPSPDTPSKPTLRPDPHHAQKRVGASKSPDSPHKATYQAIFGIALDVIPETPDEVRVEPEIGRICIGLHKASEYRLYVIARALTRSEDGSGKVAKEALRGALKRYGITYARRHLNRLLQTGKGVFWDVSRQHLYIRKYRYVSTQLAALAPALFTTNRPGVRDMYLSPVGTHEQWEAMLYAGWLAHREDPTLARATLESLFNRSQHTLRRWEQTRLASTLTIRHNEVQCPHPLHEDGRYSGHIPAHSQPYVARVKFQGQWQDVVRIRWRTSNSYQISGIRQHPKRGQARKVRQAVNSTIEQPASQSEGGPLVLKRYFDNARHLKDYTAKHHSIGYLWRGENRAGQGVFEINCTGFWFTWANERVAVSRERLHLMVQ